jgi:hypothetical protein
MRKHLAFTFFAAATGLVTIAWAEARIVAPKQEQLVQAKTDQGAPALNTNLPFEVLRPIY